MPSFRYRAMTTTGEIVTGVLDAPSERAAIQEIRNYGHLPIGTANVASESAGRKWRECLKLEISPKGRFSSRGLVIATQELAALLKAGLELDNAIEILVNLDETKPMRKTLETVLANVRDGMSLADALAESSAFPKFYVNMVRAGEEGGDLQAVLAQLGDYLARANAVRETVTSALVYPAVLLVTAGLSVIVVLVFVLPEFKPLFAEAGKSLPLSTQIVMNTGDFLTDWGWALLIAVAGLVILLRRALADPAFRLRWDRLQLHMPLLGPLRGKIEIERFGRTLSTLLANGVSLPQALTVTGDTLSNSVMANAIKEAATRLKEGEGLADYLRETGVFPSLALDLIRVGEQTGQLDAMLARQADLYERDIRHTIDRLVALLVPCLTILMGLLVAGLIASILMAILSVNDLAM